MGCASSKDSNEPKTKLSADIKQQDETRDTASVTKRNSATADSQRATGQYEPSDAADTPPIQSSTGSGVQQMSGSAGVQAMAVMAVMQQVDFQATWY